MKVTKKIGWPLMITSSTLFLGAFIAAAASSDGPSRETHGLEATTKLASNKEPPDSANRVSRPLASSPAKTAKVVEVSGRDFEQYVLKSSVPVLVDFYAHWCGPCRLQSPILEKAASEIRNARIAKIDVDEDGKLAAAYRVNSIPTLLVFKNGQVVARHTGLASEGEIKALLSD